MACTHATWAIISCIAVTLRSIACIMLLLLMMTDTTHIQIALPISGTSRILRRVSLIASTASRMRCRAHIDDMIRSRKLRPPNIALSVASGSPGEAVSGQWSVASGGVWAAVSTPATRLARCSNIILSGECGSRGASDVSWSGGVCGIGPRGTVPYHCCVGGKKWGVAGTLKRGFGGGVAGGGPRLFGCVPGGGKTGAAASGGGGPAMGPARTA